MGKNKHQTEWERVINLMTDEELQFIREHEIGYDPGFLDLVWEKKLGDVSSYIPENKAMMDAIIYLLEEMGGQCEINEDDEISFFYQGAEYSISFDKQFDYIDIIDNSWKKVSLNVPGVFEKMVLAINSANVGNSVNIAYIIDKEEEVMDIYGSSFIPYFPNMTYLRKYLHHILVDMMSSHDFVDHYFKEEEDKSIVQSFSQKTSDVAN